VGAPGIGGQVIPGLGPGPGPASPADLPVLAQAAFPLEERLVAELLEKELSR